MTPTAFGAAGVPVSSTTTTRSAGAVLRAPALAAAMLLAAGCATAPREGTPGAETPAVEPTDYRAAVEALAPEAGADGEPGLTEYALYRMLIGEFAGQRGHLELAVESYLDLAERTRDPVIAKRAAKIAVFSRALDDALTASRIWVDADPMDDEGRRILAAMLIHADRVEEAMPHLEFVLSGDDAGEQINLTANLLGRDADRERAYQVVDRLLELSPNEPEFLFAHAIFALRAGHKDIAEASMDRILEVEASNTGRIVAFVSLLQKEGDVARAVNWMRLAVEAEPAAHELRLLYARLLGEAKRFDEARQQFEHLADAHPDNAEVIYALGLLHIQAGRLDEGRERFGELIELGERETEAHFYLAQIAEAEQRQDDAIAHYREVVDSERGFHARTRIAFMLSERGEVEAALEQLDYASPDGDEQAAYLVRARGEILTQHQRYEAAMSLYDSVLDDRYDSELLYSRAMLAERMGRIDVLERDLRAILEREPNNAQALNALGYTLADRTERLEEAHGYIERALEIAPDDFYILDSMGWVLYRMGRLEDAVSYLERAREIRNDPEVAAHLGEVLWVLGDRDAARDVWNNALRDSPDAKKVLDVIQRLDQ